MCGVHAMKLSEAYEHRPIRRMHLLPGRTVQGLVVLALDQLAGVSHVA